MSINSNVCEKLPWYFLVCTRIEAPVLQDQIYCTHEPVGGAVSTVFTRLNDISGFALLGLCVCVFFLTVQCKLFSTHSDVLCKLRSLSRTYFTDAVFHFFKMMLVLFNIFHLLPLDVIYNSRIILKCPSHTRHCDM